MLENGTYRVAANKMPVIVTYLEMCARPALRDIPPPRGVTLRQITPTLDWYRDVFTRVGTHDWMWYGRLKLPQAELMTVLEDPNVVFFTLSKDGTDEALLELDFRKPGECELAYFGLTSKLIGTGAGRFLMNKAIDCAWGADITRFHLHTCTNDSPQALAFYQRSGFIPFRREVDIDDDPRATGLIPRASALAIPLI